MDGHRKLVVAALNVLLEQNRINLSASKNDSDRRQEAGHIITNLYDENTMISWSDIGHQELRLSVWWKYDRSKHPQANLTGNQKEEFRTSSPLAKSTSYPKFVGVTVSCWIEWKKGPHIQGFGRDNLFEVYTRRGEKAILEGLPSPVPKGFKAEGKFFM